VAQQIEQLFEHSPPTAARIRWLHCIVAVAAPLNPLDESDTSLRYS
jgi:hypothetical protein